MATYYEILGVSHQADHAEIKSAFRHLAKIYHPDKNSGDKELFGRILKAYETLINPVLRSRYDLKLKYQQHQGNTQQKSGTKNWRFDEREIKRRKYYEEHIKKHETTRTTYQENVPEKRSYNEYKYILFATPLAVALLLLIINLAKPEELERSPGEVEHTNSDQNVQPDIQEGPYTLYFGGTRFDSRRKNQFVIKNTSGNDVIVCLFGKKGFIRSSYLVDGQTRLIPFLPDEPLSLRYCTGRNYSPNKLLESAGVLGAFEDDLFFYKCLKTYPSASRNELTLTRVSDPNFVQVTEPLFFKLD